MAPRPAIRAPTTASIPSSYKITSTTRSLVKSLSRLSRNSLIDLALQWLKKENQPACAPYLSVNRGAEEEADEDYLHTPADTIEELRSLYTNLRTEQGTKRDVIDRILDGDWRRGITLQQLAMIDFQHLSDSPASLRWTALKLVPLTAFSAEDPNPLKPHRKPQRTEQFPRMHPSAFIQALKHEISPLVKAHYFLHRMPPPHNLTILRLYVADTPYAIPISSTQGHFTDAARTLYIAFPDSCPYIYVALAGSGGGGSGNRGGMPKVDVTALKRTVLEAVPKALSRPQQRYALETTALTAKNLSTMCVLRGNGRGGASQGAYSIFVDAKVDDGPLDVVGENFSKKVSSAEDDEDGELDGAIEMGLSRKRKVLEERDLNIPLERAEEQAKAKKRKMDVARHFGTTGLSSSTHKAPIDRLHIRLEADLILPDDDLNQRRRSSADSPVPEMQPTSTSTTRTTRSKKPSLLDAFNPHHNHPQPQPHSSSYLAALSTQASRAEDTAQPKASLTLTFNGTDVFAGIRKLAEMGFVDMELMPAWMTGEEGVSTAVVKGDGEVVGGKGAGA